MSTTDEQRLRDALERTLGNFRLMLSQKPVRDAAETIAEAERALAQQAPTPAVSPAAPDDLVQRMAELMQGSMRLWAPSKNMWLWNMMVKTIAEAKCITSISEPAAPVDARDAGVWITAEEDKQRQLDNEHGRRWRFHLQQMDSAAPAVAREERGVFADRIASAWEACIDAQMYLDRAFDALDDIKREAGISSHAARRVGRGKGEGGSSS